MIRVIAIGECMVELRPTGEDSYRRSFAGDAYNTAVYLKRSAPQIAVSFCTATGDDTLSLAMRRSWAAEAVDDDLAFALPGAAPGLYMIQTDASGDRSFQYWRSASAARQWWRALSDFGLERALAGADLVYLSGISLAILDPSDRRAALKAFSDRASDGLRLAFDPNLRLRLWDTPVAAREAIEAAARFAHILLPSRQDMDLLYGEAAPEAHLDRLRRLTEAELALTADAAGCVIDHQGERLAAAAAQVNAIDTSGAGDAFNGAYLASRLTGGSPLEAARSGLALAARVVTHPGAVTPRHHHLSGMRSDA